MSYLTKHIIEESLWEDFINAHCQTTFMQSWAWGAFEESCGHEVYRFGVYDGSNEIVAVVQAVLLKSKRGTFVYVPHGPILHSRWTQPDESGWRELQAIFEAIHRELTHYAIRQSCSFIRLNSSLADNDRWRQIMHSMRYQKAPIYLTSENAAVLDLQGKTPADLLGGMRKTTRYLVNKAEKVGVLVEVDVTGKMLGEFMKLYETTIKREGFSGLSETYIKREFEAFQKHGNAAFLTAYHKGTPLASALIIFTKKTAFYHQGASNHPNVPAPYALQRKAIQLAQDRGCEYYNFWGTYIPSRTPKSWKGLSLFKSGFGTHTVSYLRTMDFVLKPTYYLTYLYELFLSTKRGV